MPILPTLTAATATLTSTGAFTDTQTVTVGTKTYTSQTTLTNVDGNFLIGANQTASHLNLKDAVNGVANGTTTAAAMTKNDLVQADSSDGTHTVFSAKLKGTIGNMIATTETQTNASFAGAVMTGGAGAAVDTLNLIRTQSQSKSDELQALNGLLNF